MENVLAAGNLSQGDGGAFYFNYNGGLGFVNVTVAGNRAQGGGGGVFLDSDNTSTIENSIIWGNAGDSGADQVALANGGTDPVYRYSDIQGSGGSGAWDSSYGDDKGENIALNPIFLSPKQPSAAPTTGGDYRLGARSPAVDAGDDGAITLSTDLDGENRIQEEAVDMGAYEGSAQLPDPEILYVDQSSGSDGNGGTSWSDAVATLQAALSQASTNTEIWVADGVYYPDEGPNVSDGEVGTSFTLKDRVSIYGGFAGNESSRSERDPDANLVVLSGDLDQDDNTNKYGVVTSPSDQNSGSKNNPTNAYHVLDASDVSAQTVVDGVTITAGSADDRKKKDGRPEEVGGGVFIDNGSPTLSNVRIIGNRAKLDGGGIASYGGGGPVLSETVIESNRSQRNGGGIYNADGSSLRARFVVLRRNTASNAGGGIYNTQSNIRFTNVTIEGNVASSNYGGGIYTSYSNGSILTNLRLVGNRAAAGGGFYNTGGGGTKTTIGTSSFSGNYATNSSNPRGGAIFTANETLELNNSIVWGNGPNQIVDRNTFSQQSSLIEGGLGGALNQDPLFISDPTLASNGPTTDGDLQLQPTSPAGDAGANTLLPADVSDLDDDGETSEQLPLDLAGSQRVKDGDVDMGAYEGTSASLTVQGSYGADGSDAGWRDMGVPVTGSSGAITVADVERGTGTGLENLSKWGVWRDVNDSWKRLDKDSPLPAGRGFTVYLFDKRESTIDPSITFETTQGSIIGDQDVTVGDGSPTGDGELAQDAQFHFLANPYAVPYDLAELNSQAPNFSDFQTTVQVWNVDNRSYHTIDVSRFSSDRTGISSWQAFYVERFNVGSGATQLTFPSSGRLPAASNTNSFFGEKAAGRKGKSSRLGFKVVAEREGTQLMQDEAATVLVRSGASEGWDRYDATKLTPPTNKYAVIGPVGRGRDGSATMKAQESIAEISGKEQTVPLGLKVKKYAGPLRVTLNETVNVPEEWTVRLVDTKGTPDPTDDEKRLLEEGGEGYEFVYGGGKAGGGKKAGGGEAVRQVRPPVPEPIDWSPPGGEAKKASGGLEGRFRIEISRGETLPVELAGMDATVRGQQARLKWETASETQNAGFRVQHQRLAEGDSMPGPTGWESLGFVEGAGTSSEVQQYSYETEPLGYGRHAFRLRQVDADGETTSSEPIRVEVRLSGAVAIEGPSPNPVRRGAELGVTVRSSQEVRIEMYDVLGRQVRRVKEERVPGEEPQRIRIETRGLASGTYFLRVKGETFRKTRRMTVVR
ncbi:choice-of-anchor Q domain-containing protein [Salinibacter sp. 10B]|uniref:choice-of-anchor Q domain-containing protein n=2 Tax=Salinibacter sp. 10B TaxID=1923971 RepID=UPI002157AE48|nr:choice-of-anchor Q domain-containing protein [Salinibacter sp. 10B]